MSDVSGGGDSGSGPGTEGSGGGPLAPPEAPAIGPLVVQDLADAPEGLPSPDRGRRPVAIIVVAVVVAATVAAVISSWSDLKKVQETFFNWTFLTDSFPTVIKGFWVNVKLFMVAEALVLVWALAVALVRALPGRAAAPARWLAIAYVDLFRGLPAIVTIYLVGFGLPLSGLPVVSKLSLFQLGVLALTLVYGAYVAEVYRAGIESVHWSQAAAARSLGLTHRQTMRYVIVPQAVRRVVPPLLNDFIGLQKDTALLFTIGVAETLENAKLWQAQLFNLSPILVSALLFVAITIPQARFVDYLIHRDASRRAGG